jgi:hypothetical protein
LIGRASIADVLIAGLLIAGLLIAGVLIDCRAGLRALVVRN